MPYPQDNPILDFIVVNTHNPTTLGVADTSFYPTSFNIINPTLEITPPGFSVVTTMFSPNSVTIFNSNSLNITCVDNTSMLTELPDGIWTVKLSISPPIEWNIERSFLRTDNLQKKLGMAFLKTDITQCNLDMKCEQMKVIDEISFYIQAAIAAGNQCNSILAMNLYRTANTMLDNFQRGRCRGTNPTLWC